MAKYDLSLTQIYAQTTGNAANMLSCGALLRAENEDAFLHLNLKELSEEAEDDVMFDTGMIFGSVEEAVKELH